MWKSFVAQVIWECASKTVLLSLLIGNLMSLIDLELIFMLNAQFGISHTLCVMQIWTPDPNE